VIRKLPIGGKVDDFKPTQTAGASCGFLHGFLLVMTVMIVMAVMA